MKQVQPTTKRQQPLSSLVGKMTYLSSYRHDISYVTADPGGLIKEDALFSGMRHIM